MSKCSRETRTRCKSRLTASKSAVDARGEAVRAANSRRTIKPSKLVRATKIDFRFPSRARVSPFARSPAPAETRRAAPRRDMPRLLSSMPRTAPPPRLPSILTRTRDKCGRVHARYSQAAKASCKYRNPRK